MSFETTELFQELTAEESYGIQGGLFMNVPFYSPAVGLTSDGKLNWGANAPLSYGSKTEAKNYGSFAYWDGKAGGPAGVSGVNLVLPGVTGWADQNYKDPTARNSGAIQAFW